MALKTRRKPNEVSLTHCPFCGHERRKEKNQGLDEYATDGGVPDPGEFRIPTVAELDAMRVRHGLSQAEFSRRAGLEQTRFNTILNKDIDPQTRTLRAFLDVLKETEPDPDDELSAGPQGPDVAPSSLREEVERIWAEEEQTGGETDV